jgi:type I restriction enzyme M protein
LKQLIVNLIDKVDWLSLPVDVKGTIYEELLSRSAQESSRGAGQYFTPRPVIEAICQVMQATPADTICDPAAGTGGFLCTAYNYLLDRHERDLDADEKRALRGGLVEGMELSTKVGRMCAMNLYLHGIGSESVVVMHTGHDSLLALWGKDYSMVLTNPPFGKKQSLLFVNEEGGTEKEDQIVVREDFWTSTSNKQLNFVQHIYSLLKIDGRAAVVVPGNVLFEGGAGEKVRRNLLQKCRVHTLLRLPTGIWYSPGVKANVIFFDKKEGRAEARRNGAAADEVFCDGGVVANHPAIIGFAEALSRLQTPPGDISLLSISTPRLDLSEPLAGTRSLSRGAYQVGADSFFCPSRFSFSHYARGAVADYRWISASSPELR